jgi:hypothetical protein
MSSGSGVANGNEIGIAFNRELAYRRSEIERILRISDDCAMTGWAFIVVVALFCLKILWNLAVPYVLAGLPIREDTGRTQRISLMPYLELVLLVVAIIVSWTIGDSSWPWTPGE